MGETVDIDSFTVESSQHGPVAATVVRPRATDARAAALFLYGGGGSEQTLVDISPLLSEGFASGSIPPMTVGCVGVPPWCFYLDDPDRGWGFETLVARELPAALNGRYELEPRPALLGISMGGYGALKIAFRHPESWRAVAAIAPMIEPSLDADGASLRNRFHYPPQCPGPLVGPDRDGALYERNHPAALARANAGPLRESQLPIWFDAGSRDSVHAHDGAEFLHRTLWDLDILHEYRLHRDADHIGPLLPARLVEAFGWIGRQLASPNLSPTPEQVALHEALADARAEAARADPTVLRHYGRL